MCGAPASFLRGQRNEEGASNAIPAPPPLARLPKVSPSLARSLVTVAVQPAVIHKLEPSKAIPAGQLPAAYVPTADPSLGRSFVTVLSAVFAIQRLAASKLVELTHKIIRLLDSKRQSSQITPGTRREGANQQQPESQDKSYPTFKSSTAKSCQPKTAHPKG